MRKGIVILIGILLVIGGFLFLWYRNPLVEKAAQSGVDSVKKAVLHPLAIESLRVIETPGSELVIEETLSNGSNYRRFIASYDSDGYKQYGLLTIPEGEKPESGWPVIIFNHGYVPPTEYRTTERYIAYTDAFSRNGYILFRPDYRGHGESEGTAGGGYSSNDYVIDVLNALESVRAHPDADKTRMGMWGHSMGGHITLRTMVVRDDIKAGVIWAGVVGSYEDLLYNWHRRGTTVTPLPSVTITSTRGGRWRQLFVDQFGTPEDNKTFWDSISATSYLSDISGPLQIHHGTADSSVPVAFSEQLDERLKNARQESELFIYEGDDHNISAHLRIALERSVAFFDEHVKGEE
ncbi:alpha/beta fold hydrolase [Candidatus Woesebacteria bacterium]|nr:alpha/beta fold hydrolase [Candidatus Woesebacteria bacterium]